MIVTLWRATGFLSNLIKMFVVLGAQQAFEDFLMKICQLSYIRSFHKSLLAAPLYLAVGAYARARSTLIFSSLEHGMLQMYSWTRYQSVK